jgi:hypothetical protein
MPAKHIDKMAMAARLGTRHRELENGLKNMIGSPGKGREKVIVL